MLLLAPQLLEHHALWLGDLFVVPDIFDAPIH